MVAVEHPSPPSPSAPRGCLVSGAPRVVDAPPQLWQDARAALSCFPTWSPAETLAVAVEHFSGLRSRPPTISRCVVLNHGLTPGIPFLLDRILPFGPFWTLFEHTILHVTFLVLSIMSQPHSDSPRSSPSTDSVLITREPAHADALAGLQAYGEPAADISDAEPDDTASPSARAAPWDPARRIQAGLGWEPRETTPSDADFAAPLQNWTLKDGSPSKARMPLQQMGPDSPPTSPRPPEAAAVERAETAVGRAAPGRQRFGGEAVELPPALLVRFVLRLCHHRTECHRQPGQREHSGPLEEEHATVVQNSVPDRPQQQGLHFRSTPLGG